MENNQMSTKKAILVLGSLLVLVGLSLVIPARYVGIKTPKRDRINLDINNDLVQLQKDTDNNGAPDWRDLLKSQMSTTTKEAAKNVVVDEAAKKRLADPNNITASFSKNVYTATAYAKQQGNLTQAEQEAIAATIAEQEAAKIIIKTYEITDLHLTKDETTDSKKVYINNLGKIYTKNKLATMTVDDGTNLKAYTESKDVSILASFVVKKNILDTVITQLTDMTVPYSAATYHILLLNSLSAYASLIGSVSTAQDDPLRAAIALKTYGATIKGLYSSLLSFGNYIALEEITLTPSDPGYILISK